MHAHLIDMLLVVLAHLFYPMESLDTRVMQVLYSCPWYKRHFPERLNIWDGGSIEDRVNMIMWIIRKYMRA